MYVGCRFTVCRIALLRLELLCRATKIGMPRDAAVQQGAVGQCDTVYLALLVLFRTYMSNSLSLSPQQPVSCGRCSVKCW